MVEGLYRSFEEQIKAHQMIHTNEKVVIGVSGGADSVCLLLLLHMYGKTNPCSLHAVHVNHMIRGKEADEDQAFVEKLCKELSVPCTVKAVDVPSLAKERHESLEEAGRKARYDCLLEIAKEEGAVIAVAHHKNDNAETVLLNLARGSGIRGLSGMKAVSEMDGVRIIRPLLEISREEIEAFLNEQEISFCTDATNLDDGYARNAVRLNVLPDLLKINKKAVEHITESAAQLSEIEEYLEAETEKAFREAAEIQGAAQADANSNCEIAAGRLVLKITTIEKLPDAILNRVVHKALAAAAGSAKDISSSHISDVLSLMRLQSGRRICLPYGLTATRQYDEILIQKEKEEDAAQSYVTLSKEELDSEQIFTLPEAKTISFHVIEVDDSNRAELIQKNLYTKAFDYDTIKGTINVGEKVPGDRIFLRGGMKTVKKYFMDEKIPAEERKKILLLRDEESVMWIIGFRISEPHKITAQTKRALIVNVTDGGKHELRH